MMENDVRRQLIYFNTECVVFEFETLQTRQGSSQAKSEVVDGTGVQIRAWAENKSTKFFFKIPNFKKV